MHTNNAAKELVLLLVEDDRLTSEMVSLRIGGLFKRVVVAGDGREGLRLFRECAPDIVLTDQSMPILSGMEMVREIRETDQVTPIILMTFSMDHRTLVEAINLGISKYIAKPFDFGLFTRVLNEIIGDIMARRDLERSRRQEIELLRYRDKYNSMQQEAARHKERHLLRHDLRGRDIAGQDGSAWNIEVEHISRDTMCGDGYTIRTLFDGRLLIFIVDAMGSGLSASLSALLATSFCNYQVEHLDKWRDFSLDLFLSRFREYMSVILVEDEVLACGFLLLDPGTMETETAFFGMPPLLARLRDGTVRRIAGGNMPLCMYTQDIKMTGISLKEVNDLLIMTDGFTDASLLEGGMYRQRLEQDFGATESLVELLAVFREQTESGDLDDMTLVHLRRCVGDGARTAPRRPHDCLTERRQTDGY